MTLMADTLCKAFVYRLYPTPAQESAMVQTLSVCRDVYNSMVNWRKHDFEVRGQSPCYYDLLLRAEESPPCVEKGAS